MRMTPQQFEEHQRKHGFATVTPKAPLLPLMIATENRIDFFMQFDPPETTSQQKGEQVIVPKDPTKRPFLQHFKKKKTIEAEQLITAQLFPFIPQKPMTGPLRIVAEWTWSWRESEPKKNRVLGWRWRDTKPDLDNMSKMLLDRMAFSQFYENDSQIADLRITKQWGDNPGIRITIEQLQQP